MSRLSTVIVPIRDFFRQRSSREKRLFVSFAAAVFVVGMMLSFYFSLSQIYESAEKSSELTTGLLYMRTHQYEYQMNKKRVEAWNQRLGTTHFQQFPEVAQQKNISLVGGVTTQSSKKLPDSLMAHTHNLKISTIEFPTLVTFIDALESDPRHVMQVNALSINTNDAAAVQNRTFSTDLIVTVYHLDENKTDSTKTEKESK